MGTTNVFEFAIDLNKSFQKIQPIAAIWLSKPVWLVGKRTARIEKNDKIRVEYRGITDIDITNDKPATHTVLECYGNISNSVLYFELENMRTKELSTLNIK